MDIQSDCIPRIGTGLGGGLGKHGEVCGALNGGSILLSLVFGRTEPDQDAREKAYAKVARFVSRFEELNGGKRCQDLLGLSVGNISDKQVYNERSLRERVCLPAVRSAARSAVELILDETQD